VKEFALAGIATMEARTCSCAMSISPPQRAFCGEAVAGRLGFRRHSGVDLREILCVQEERQVGNDNCVSFNRLKLQIPESPLRAHFVKATVKVRHYQDGSYAIFHGQRCLGRYDKKGAIEETKQQTKRAPESARRPACGNVDKASA